jgi:hypothetical protein
MIESTLTEWNERTRHVDATLGLSVWCTLVLRELEHAAGESGEKSGSADESLELLLGLVAVAQRVLRQVPSPPPEPASAGGAVRAQSPLGGLLT